MPQALTSYEQQQQRIAARKKRNEEYYKRFITNPKQRAMGIDTSALSKQIADKKAAEDAAAEEEFQRTMQTEEILSVLETQKLQADAASKAENAKYKALWDAQVANKQFKREFDLNDKDSLKKELPARVGDNDPRLGPASLQIFSGEDLNKVERVKKQKAQMRSWIAESTRKHELDRRLANEEEMAHAQYIHAVEKLREKNEMDKQAFRRAENVATLNRNKDLSSFRNTLKNEEKLQAEQTALNEVKMQSESKFLNEDASQGVSSMDSKRYRVDHFKGMEMGKVKKIYEEVAQQQQEREMLRISAKEEDLSYAQDTAEILDVLAMQNLKVKQEKKQSNYEAMLTLKKQIEEKAARDVAEKEARRNLSIEPNGILSFGKSFR